VATYYLIGIKGSGMSALAQVLHDLGNEVLGSDIDDFTFTQIPLEQSGIKIFKFSADNLKAGYQVIIGNAFADDFLEVVAAKAKGLKIKTYPEVLEELIGQSISIGVAGAHGKTSTTGLLSEVLGEVSPTSFLIGDGTGKGIQGAKFFVFEADEYQRHFSIYTPDYAIMTNIDFDHPDYFTGIDDVTLAFSEFADNVKKGVIAWGDDPHLKSLKPKQANIYFYGLNPTNDFVAVNIQRSTNGSNFDVLYQEKFIGNFSIPLFGEHGILNALATISVAFLEDLDISQIQKGLDSFKGVKRRFSQRDVEDITIIDDYAHHPSEIRATLDATRQKFPDKEIVAVFQPHTFSRLIAYKDDFARSLSLADQVFLVEIFGSAREQNGSISSEDLGKEIPQFQGIISQNNMTALLEYHDAVIVFMGAGDISKYETVYERLLTQIRGTRQ
jgi:UDP-N-acetylmuramate--alanine ligase